MSIYRTSVNHPVTTALVFVAFAILGFYSLTKLPVDNFPDVESNTIMVMSSYPGASAEDVENNLTYRKKSCSIPAFNSTFSSALRCSLLLIL